MKLGSWVTRTRTINVLAITGLQTTRFYATSNTADDENLGIFGATSPHGTVFAQGNIYIFFFYGNRFMQQQRSQEDSYIHKRLIANINLGPCTKTKTLHSRYI